MTATDPKWLTLAVGHIGLREIPGAKHNQTIINWLVKLKAWWKDDETPWCGTFVANCLNEAGQPIIKNWMRAKDWASYGSNLRLSCLARGAILVFVREGGGHVGFYVGEDTTHYHVLGGNQGNAVSVTRIAKARLIAARWPKDVPVLGGPVLLTAAGVPVSKNEA